jgi:RNA polymerase sigma factor (sigma-70 family)
VAVPPPVNAVGGQASPRSIAEADRAITAMYDTEYHSLVRMSAVLLGDVGAAEEVVQECFIAVHAAWRRLRDIDKAMPYLRRSVLNRSRSLLRHRIVADRHAPAPEPDTGGPRAGGPRAGGPGAGGPGTGSAEQGAIAWFERSAVIAALRGLPSRQREALVLRFYLELSEEEVAAVMKISRGAVKSHTARGQAALRSVLEPER